MGGNAVAPPLPLPWHVLPGPTWTDTRVKEIGYIFRQYKRINVKSSSRGKPFLLAMDATAPGYGVVYFTNKMFQDHSNLLQGKRVLIVGAGKVARSVAEKLISFGAVPLSFSDKSGHIYEPNGINEGKLATIKKIKNKRGALLGRYIIASTTAQFNDPKSLLDIPCDLCVPCAGMGDINEAAMNKLADNGCVGIIKGGHGTVTPEARMVLKKRGIMYGPDKLTLIGPSIAYALGHKHAMDERLASEVARIYKDMKLTAQKFNARGDLFVGANIARFLRVANVMTNHDAV